MFIFPAFSYAQDTPLIEQKVTNEKMEKKEQAEIDKLEKEEQRLKDNKQWLKDKKQRLKDKLERERNRCWKNGTCMSPKNQWGYITNFTAHPYGGVNYYSFDGWWDVSDSEHLGWYFDWRPSFNYLHPDNYTNTDNYLGNQYSTFNETLWTGVFNFGFAVNIIRSQHAALILYAGIGSKSQKTYSGYELSIEDGYRYVQDGERITRTNYNFGVLYQPEDRSFSFQVGFDSAIPGINIGIGFP